MCCSYSWRRIAANASPVVTIQAVARLARALRVYCDVSLKDFKGKGWKNAQIPMPKTLAAMDVDQVGFASPAVPLPADVANAAGLAAGAKVLGAT